MSERLIVRPTDRVMVLAPHPDDESLATAGILQRACAAGATSRVLFLTDGENNPWAQRAVERRWRISPADRSRWGRKRREEALSALACIGVPRESVRFLGYPDQGLCDLLMTDPDPLLQELSQEITAWRPTVLVDPSPADRHPDHGALAVLTAFALAESRLEGAGPTRLRYLVHGRNQGLPDSERVTLHLTEAEQDRKRRAILMHRSQLPLRGRAILRFAGPEESFLSTSRVSAREVSHPVKMCSLERGSLHLAIGNGRRLGFGPRNLIVAIRTESGSTKRLVLEVPSASGPFQAWNAATGERIAVGSCTRIWIETRMVLPLHPSLEARTVYVKLDRPSERRLGFFDAVGWRPVPVLPLPLRTEVEELAPRPVPVRRSEVAVP